MTRRPYTMSINSWPQMNFVRVRPDAKTVPLESTPPIDTVWTRWEKPGAAVAGVLIGLGICMLVLG